MEDILNKLLPLFKELTMQYGLWETTAACFLLIAGVVLVWRLPNIITALKEGKNNGNFRY